MLSWKKWIAPHWFGSFRRKVKSAFKAKFAKGQRIFAYAPIGCRKDPEGKACAWTIAQVKSILKDETYIENSVHYRETNISYKNKKRIRKDPSEWVRVEGTHEAIISKDVFDRVQEQIATRRRSMKDQTTQIFSRLLKCAGCGWSMRFRTKRQIKKPYRHYDCSRYGQLGNQCSAHYVRYDVL
ncbi:MAG: recombinase family protein [Flavonifractor plautii]